MGLFGFLRKGKKAEEVRAEAAVPESEAREVSFDGVREAVGRQLDAKIAGERQEAEELYDRIKFNLVHIRKLAGELEKKSFESGEKIYAPVNMLKNNYVKKALSLLGSVPNVENFEHAEMSEFSRKTQKILHELMNIPAKQAVLLTRYFKKEASRMIMLLKETEEARAKMDMLLREGSLKIAWEVNAGVESISELLEKAKDFDRHGIAFREKMKDKKKELEEREKEREAFLSGEEMRHFRAAGDEISRMEKERDEISGRISEDLSAIKRPVKKLEHAAASGETIDREKLALFSRIAHSPVKVLMQEQGDSLLMGALVRLRGLNLKDNERTHVEELIKKIELGYLSGLADRHKWLESEISGKKAAFEKADAPEKHKKKEREIEHLRRDIAEMETELEKIAKSKADLAERIKSEKTRLEGAILSGAGMRLDIAVGD